MKAEAKHRRGVQLFAAGRNAEALALMREALGEEDNSERWNDWATLQYLTGHFEEAEAGYRIAIDMNRGNTQAALNLGVLLKSKSRIEEAVPFLEIAQRAGNSEEKAAAEQLLKSEGRKEGSAPTTDHQLEAYLRRFLSSDSNERSYFETHIKRYVATLSLLPRGNENMKVLELGAAFHHVTPALIKCKGYGEVCCNDIWLGPSQQTRRVVSNTGEEEFVFVVDNFDVQATRWPYPDGGFDAVLCCEMLEHLHSDPMGLMAEINRVLKPEGVLLLTTPNLACGHAVESALKGESPYVYGRFERGGGATDRHNREYTAGEVERLASAAGFGVVVLRTMDSWWECRKELLRTLAAHGFPIARRGDNTILLGRKQSEVRERYPKEFYQNVGTQVERRSAQSGEAGVTTEKETEYTPPRNILMVHEVLPHFDCSGSDLRLMDVIREIRRQGHQLTYVARDARNFEKYAPAMEALGVKVVVGDSERMRHIGDDRPTPWSFRELLERGRFHAAILFHWYWSGISVAEDYAEDIRKFSSETRILVLTDDRHGERERRLAALSGSFSDLERGNDFEVREEEVYGRADLVLHITEADKKRFLELCPNLQTELLPMQAEGAPEGPGFAERDGVLFLGNFDNLANGDALQWMLESIWPLVIKEEPGLTLFVAGNAAPKDLEKLYANVKCLGRVEELAPVFAACRVFAAPVRYGTGINTKNLQALAHGLPIVTTSVGAEGIGLEDGVNALVTDKAREFAVSVLRLHRDVVLWKRIASGGRSIIASNFSHRQFETQIRKIMARSAELPVKPLDPGYVWSYRAVEKSNPEVLTQRPARYRHVLRMFAYWQAGHDFLAQGHAAEALSQFRHIFSMQRGELPATVFYTSLFSDMAGAYRGLGDEKSAKRCEEEGLRLAGEAPSKPSTKQGFKREGGHSPEISVIIPTCNRKETLRLCLAALAFQFLSVERWEIVVVDDGSTDGTDTFCRECTHPFSNLKFIRQENQGAGAARRAGIEAARGEFVLLMNDDTIASSNLLVEHLKVQRQNSREKLAVLGAFRPSEECIHRALSFWINHSKFFFPQNTLKPGSYPESAYFISCNLSIRRNAVLEAGNFDPRFRVAEDTELGTRLTRKGYRVLFHPEAGAWHEHAQFTVNDLLRRARAYGEMDWMLFQKHPHLLGNGTGPFGMLREADRASMKATVEKNREAVAVSMTALEALEQMELLPFFQKRADGSTGAEELWQKLAKIVPMVYWQYLFESFLGAWETKGEKDTKEVKAAPQVAAVP